MKKPRNQLRDDQFSKQIYKHTGKSKITEKDIESLGFVDTGKADYEEIGELADSYTYQYDNTENREKSFDIYVYSDFIIITREEYQNSVGCSCWTLFKGTIKNKSELKRILKMIGYEAN